MRSLVSLILFLAAAACSRGGGADQGKNGAVYSGDAAAIDPLDGAIDAATLKAVALPIRGVEIIQDALDYTFASVEITPAEKGAYSLRGRYVLVDQKTLLNAETRVAMDQLCQSLGIVSDNGMIKVWWRSHYSDARRLVFASVLQAGLRDLHCVMHVEGQGGGSYFLSFDPMPTPKSLVLGTTQSAKAVSNGLMMMSAGLSLDGKTLVPVGPSPGVFETVRAIGALAQSAVFSEETGAACALVAGSQTEVSNPLQVKEFIVRMEGVRIKSARSVPVAGKTLQACEAISVIPRESELQLKFTCGDYQRTRNEGLEAGCQWALTLENPLDSEDAAISTLGMPRILYQQTGSRSWALGKEAVAKSPLNPIRLANVQLSGFNSTQLVFLEKVFDVILDVAPEIYQMDFAGYMKSMSLGVSGSCATPGVMGFAAVGGNSITLCQYMFGAGIDSPGAIIGAAHTIIHEVRHSRGFYHDFDRPAYTPCQGTAYSNVFDHNVVVSCESSYCPLLKSAAEGSYLNDINYSLRNDDRRFLGLCKDWQTHMGFSDDRVRTGR